MRALISLIAGFILAKCLHFLLFPVAKQTCPENFSSETIEFDDVSSVQTECFFRNSYRDARNLFLESARLAGAELTELPVSQNLITDVAVFKGSNEKVLLHISGTHGTEGYAGSASQVQRVINNHVTDNSILVISLCQYYRQQFYDIFQLEK